MKKIKLLIFALFLIFQTFGQTNFTVDSVSYKFRVDTLFSNALKENRFIKIWLPSDYSKANKYPVFFVLDEDWMFEPTMVNVKQLIDAKIIPSSIVVGVHSNNRSKDLRLGSDGNFTEGSSQFYQYINTELFSYLDKTITDPAFPILIGHSDGAVFSEKVLTQPDQNFRAIISLSIQLAEGQFQEITQLTKSNISKDIFHFVASGTKDATYRLVSANKIDSLFKTVTNEHLHLKAQIYNIDHFAVAERALSDGISFVFNDFVEENDWNDLLIDSLKRLNVNPIAYVKEYQNKISQIYNIKVLPRDEGVLSVANAIVQNKKQLQEFWDYKISIYGKDENYNSFYAQDLETLNEFDEALKYWKLNLIDTTGSFSKSFFYFRRPIDLIAYKLNRPKQALEFADEWQKKRPEYILYFNYIIAKICADKKFEIDKGKSAIKYCIDNYKTNGLFSIDNAKDIEIRLSK